MEKEIIKFKLPKLGFNISTLIHNSAAEWRSFHIHNAVELVRPDTGSITFETQNKREVLFSDKVLLINSAVPHRLSADSDAIVTYIQIDLKSRQNLNIQNRSHIHDFITQNTDLPYVIVEKPNELFDIFSNLRREAETQARFFSEYIDSDISRLYAFMLRYGVLKGIDREQLKRLERLMPVIEYIETHFSEYITLDNAALVANQNKFSLCRDFKAATGGTFIGFLNFVRLKNAEQMLKNTQKSILDISYECGFSSVQYFNKLFKEHMHRTPGSLRRDSSIGDL